MKRKTPPYEKMTSDELFNALAGLLAEEAIIRALLNVEYPADQDATNPSSSPPQTTQGMGGRK